jgi:predicted alpha/beta hydrolase family esterase
MSVVIAVAPPRRSGARAGSRTPVLLVPGLGDSGPGHWLSSWAREHPSFRRVAQSDAESPRLDAWAATVARAIDTCGAPPLVVAHGYGCLATVRAAWYFERTLAGALLVAPTDPVRTGDAAKLPTRALPYASVLVAGSNDPTLKLMSAALMATRWGSRFVPLAGAGHVNEASGHDRWPEGLRLLAALRDASSPSRDARGAPRSVS